MLSLLSSCTVNRVEPVILPDKAVIVVVPAVTEVASPDDVPIFATVSSEELQVTEVVISFVELSE
jgi:hypothetical protein